MCVLAILTGWAVYVSGGLLLSLGLAQGLASLLGIKTVNTPFLFLFVVLIGAMAGATSGVIAGFVQWLGVRRFVRGGDRWVLGTASGWAVGWALVWLFAHIYGEFGLRGVQYGLVGAESDAGAAAGGLLAWALVGTCVGMWQQQALRGAVKQANWWIPFNAVSWGMGAIACWALGAVLNAGPAMYWSIGYAFTAWEDVMLGVISSAGGWLVTGVLTALGLKALFAPGNRAESADRPRAGV